MCTNSDSVIVSSKFSSYQDPNFLLILIFTVIICQVKVLTRKYFMFVQKNWFFFNSDVIIFFLTGTTREVKNGYAMWYKSK